jgi:cyclopropane fatty-acyl-phospholipid synthase-like methyltransferase
VTDDSSEGPISYYVYPKAYLSHFQIPPFGRWLTNNHRSMADALPPLPADARILEVGSGPGQFTRQLARSYPKANIVAIDSSRGMVRFSRRDGTPDNVEFRITDFRDVEGVYDLIVGSGCWEFLPLDRCIDQIELLLAPDGVAIINTIGPTMWARTHQLFFALAFRARVRLFQPRLLEEALTQRGFTAAVSTVNPWEGTYTIVARRATSTSPPAR